jgi:hypothetical protein
VLVSVPSAPSQPNAPSTSTNTVILSVNGSFLAFVTSISNQVGVTLP